MPSYKLISFDVDDTLMDFTTMQHHGTDAVLALISERLGEAGAHITRELLYERYKAVAITHDPTKKLWWDLRRESYSAVLAEAGYADHEALSQELFDAYKAAFDGNITFNPGALDLLAALRDRYKLGWVTNGHNIPSHVGMDGQFAVVITPDRDGIMKPDPVVLQQAAAAVGCEVSEVLHIGDSLYSDVAGARNAGCTAVWYNPRGKANETEHVPHVEIQHLEQVLDLL